MYTPVYIVQFTVLPVQWHVLYSAIVNFGWSVMLSSMSSKEAGPSITVEAIIEVGSEKASEFFEQQQVVSVAVALEGVTQTSATEVVSGASVSEGSL